MQAPPVLLQYSYNREPYIFFQRNQSNNQENVPVHLKTKQSANTSQLPVRRTALGDIKNKNNNNLIPAEGKEQKPALKVFEPSEFWVTFKNSD